MILNANELCTSLENRLDQLDAAVEEEQRQLASRPAAERSEVLRNRNERVELDRLYARFYGQCYTDAELQRLKELRRKHELI